ncbi:MAG: hypothetical protein M3468_12950 [Acidobacteriota bacterium]|nr:hypothetical protein [Acidobacteriota bacterium]
MTTKQSVGLVITVAALLGVGYCAVQRFGFQSEDRPAMIVKGGSIHLELQPVKGKSQSPEWVDEAGAGWKPAQANTKGVTMFLVAVTNPKSGDCENMTGPQVQLTHSAIKRPIIIMEVNGEPSVRPKDLFTANNTPPLKQIYNMDAGTIIDIQVGGNKCELNPDSVVWIWP